MVKYPFVCSTQLPDKRCGGMLFAKQAVSALFTDGTECGPSYRCMDCSAVYNVETVHGRDEAHLVLLQRSPQAVD